MRTDDRDVVDLQVLGVVQRRRRDGRKDRRQEASFLREGPACRDQFFSSIHFRMGIGLR